MPPELRTLPPRFVELSFTNRRPGCKQISRLRFVLKVGSSAAATLHAVSHRIALQDASAGGLSDKVGNRFEDRWTVRCAFDVLEEHATSIRLEPPGEAGDGVEFWIRYEDRTVYHQCKRQRTGQGHWTLAALHSAGVLRAFLGKLANPAVHCEFASTHAGINWTSSQRGRETPHRLSSSTHTFSTRWTADLGSTT